MGTVALMVKIFSPGGSLNRFAYHSVDGTAFSAGSWLDENNRAVLAVDLLALSGDPAAAFAAQAAVLRWHTRACEEFLDRVDDAHGGHHGDASIGEDTALWGPAAALTANVRSAALATSDMVSTTRLDGTFEQVEAIPALVTSLLFSVADAVNAAGWLELAMGRTAATSP